MSEPITCLIVDDHEVVREGLRLSLSRSENIRVVGEAADGEAAVTLAKRRKPNVVILDVRMPGMDGLAAAKEITSEIPETAVLMFTAFAERSLLTRGLESGAGLAILKSAASDDRARHPEGGRWRWLRRPRADARIPGPRTREHA